MSSTPSTSSRVRPEPFLDERTALTCIHCGLCLVACPTFLETGNENFSPRGRIYMMRQLQSGRAPLNASSVRLLDLCLGCRGCESVCPSGVHYGQLLETSRDYVERKYHRSLFQFLLRRAFVEQVFPYPWRMKLALLPLKLLRALRLERLLPKSLRDITALVPTGGPAVTVPEFSPAATVQKKGRVGFMTGCVQSVLFSPTNAASVRLLNRAGYDVVVPPAQGCCGALYSHTGRLAKA
ncbi:MAG: 4Fe-4S dicluster domain-containing protein, partial [Verrucomicrobiae bacterium]|nr:4Fe-4S dicluster domain-containing protein [Verrucomicrobiae bacterium]